MVNFTKNKHTYGLACILLVMILGCKTPPPPPPPPPPPRPVTETVVPFTYPILQRLNEYVSLETDIKLFQFLLRGRIVLEKEGTTTAFDLKSGKTTFTDSHVREVITINDQTEGQALKIVPSADRVTLYVCFEIDDKKYLPFSKMVNGDEYFYLDFTPDDSASNEIKGTLAYGGNTYTLKYTGEKRPSLLIKLSQTDVDRLAPHTAPGRKVD
jgi:hypothetical protein